MSAKDSFSSKWAKLKTPRNPDDLATDIVRGTNAYLTKDHDGALGLFLHDVTDSLPSRRYEHLNITIEPRRDLHIPGRKPKILQNCLILDADSQIQTPVLTLILERLYDHAPSGRFSAANLITVLDEVEEILRRPKPLPSKEEVIGAWGELYVLRLLVQTTADPAIQRAILSGWEGEIREKLDFRFLHALQVLEVKTTTGDERIHHFHGLKQVTVPMGFDAGALASLRIVEHEGCTCINLLEEIEGSAIGTKRDKDKLAEILATRVLVRGRECDDDRFHFDLVQNGLAFYDLSEVLKPGEVDGVTPIEWISDLSSANPLVSTEVDALIRRITPGSGS